MDNYVCASCGFRWYDPSPTGLWCPVCEIAKLEAKVAELEAIIRAMQEARAGDVTTIDEILQEANDG